jgi:alkyldihydroxyacetonephosphate synthase
LINIAWRDALICCGKMFAPWLESSIGKNEFAVYRALKRHFDPDNVMNPGGTLGLNLPESEKR